jgi:hypothetical protein
MRQRASPGDPWLFSAVKLLRSAAKTSLPLEYFDVGRQVGFLNHDRATART